ncbi:MAG: hypothetical protein LBH06_03400 [Rikenellaceae bacterium]|jgi:hypothetical protein|nr:hypothetical protein [Rikenellaceae bacterium]
MPNILAVLSTVALLTGCLGDIADRQIARAAAEVNSECPQIVDNDMRLDSVAAAPGRRLLYYFTLPRLATEEIDAAAFDSIRRANAISFLRESDNPYLALLHVGGTTFCYRVRDRNGLLFWTLDITPEMYKKN